MTAPEMPDQLWMFWDPESGQWLIDQDSGTTDIHVVCLFQTIAENYASYLHHECNIDVVPVRVK